MRRVGKWLAALALLAPVLAFAGQDPYLLYDVQVSSPREAQQLGDSPLRILEEDIHIGTNRVAIRKGEEWQLLSIALPVRFAGVHEVRIPESGSGDADYRTEWLTYAELIAEWDGMAQAHPDLVTKSVIGATREGRPIYAYRVYRQNRNDVLRPPKSILILGDTHAREWMSPSVVLHLGKMLVNTLSSETSAFTSRLEDRVGVFFVPVFNVDGYLFSWSTDRFWRKNRRNNGNNIYGVDLNRNYEKAWGGAGSSSNPASDTYRGPSAASEPEIQAIRSFALSLRNLIGVIDYHSYAAKILYPWSYTTTAPPPAAVAMHQTTGNAIKNGMIAGGSNAYIVGQGSVALYVASGTSKDWFYDRFLCPSFTVEVEGSTFDPPESTITPVQDHNWMGFKFYLEERAPLP